MIFDFYNESKINVEILNETAILETGKFIGITYLFFTASDSFDTTTSNVFKIEVKESKKIPKLKSLRQIIGLI